MASLAALHSQLQSVLSQRGWADLSLRPTAPPEMVSCGVRELDEHLGGGFPRGALTEICGPASSGRTSLLYSFLTQITRRQEVCALVDVSDASDPESLAAAGVNLQQLLWVRCGVKNSAAPPKVELQAPPPVSGKRLGLLGGRSRHPREEVRELETAMSFLLDARTKPVLPIRGAPKEYAVIARCSGEQVALDRESPRRVNYFLEQRQEAPVFREPALRPSRAQCASSQDTKPWQRIEQALKVTDLLLNGGGFGAVVLDFGDVLWADARRVPLTSWFRFRRAVENTPTVLMLLAEASCATTCASLVLNCKRTQDNWQRADSPGNTRATLQGFSVRVELLRARRMQEIAPGAHIPPGRATEWRTRAQWTG